MPIQSRIGYRLPNPGPFLAKVTNHLDTTYMGSLEVVLIKGYSNDPEIQSQTYIVNYLSPFYGVTDVKFEGTTPSNFDDVQKSYGMWMVPPDVGATVMVLFLDGDPNQGYWIGCVLNDRFQNHMVPGIAASSNVSLSPEQKKKYGTSYLPAAEFHKRSIKSGSNPNTVQKPVHPFADKLLAQGLLIDKERGVTSSSARREVPSAVFGISTPGRLDPSGKKGQTGYDSKVITPVSRTGGHTFVMDDGDSSGDNQLVRIRSSAGHQILLNDTSNILYISNANGSAWLEMTASGKIDIYSEDSVSIHSKNDFNFRADRDINIEAGRNLNVNAIGSADINVGKHLYLFANEAGKLAFAKTLDVAVANEIKVSTSDSFHINTGASIFVSANADMNLASEGAMKLSTGSTMNLGSSGVFKASASQIHLNGPAASAAIPASNAETPSLLPLYSVPQTSVSAGWENSNFYKDGKLSTIMQRVPMHEPWSQHENLAPSKFTPSATDASATPRPDVPPPNSTTTGDAATDTRNDQAITPVGVNGDVSQPGQCSIEAIKAMAPASAQAGIAAIKAACFSRGVFSDYAVASILAIVGGESKWVPTDEQYSYSAAGLEATFSKTFRGNPELAKQYARWSGSPIDFFNFVYAPENNGASLGNVRPGDGGKFYGRGLIQLTGRANYAKYGTLAGVDLIKTPTLLTSDLATSAVVAVEYIKDRVQTQQTDPAFFEAALAAVGGSRASWTTKRDYYQCFLATLQAVSVNPETGVKTE